MRSALETSVQSPSLHHHMLLFALRFFKVQTTTTTTSMVMFDSQNVLRKYENVLDVMREFYDTRIDLYRRRKVTSLFLSTTIGQFSCVVFFLSVKAYLEGLLAAESLELDNKARFILEKIQGEVKVGG